MRKKTITLLLLILIVPLISMSQISGRVIYISILENENFVELESTLYFNDSESLFFVDMKNKESKENELDELKLISDSEIEYQFDFTPKRPVKYEVYFNRSLESIISQNSIFKDWKSKPCVVGENSGSIKWNIHNEFRDIGSFNAQKATTSFRGRNYIAWFVSEVPISIGPWKFHGLPGLILEIKDEELGVQFLFSSIQIPFETRGKILPPSDGELMSIEEFAKYQNNFSEEFIKTLKSKLPRSVVDPKISVSQVVRSIEREYE